MVYWIAVVGLLAAGAWLRMYQLDRYPLGVHQDELSNIYDGFSLATTGADRAGDRFPIALRGFGERDYRPAMYAWLAAIPQRFTGFSISGGRLPSAILGILSLVLVFAAARMMGRPGFALAALLFATLSPLHIQYSRVAHEGAILPAFFVSLILFLWLFASERKYRPSTVALLGFAVGLSTNTYQAPRLTAALFAVFVIIAIVVSAARRGAALLAFVTATFVGAAPQLLFLLQHPARFFGRAQTVGLETDNPVGFARELVKNYWLNLEPRYLFVPPEIVDLSVARLLPPEIVFFYAGLILLAFLDRGRARRYVYLALGTCILPAALTSGNPNPLRASPMAVLTPFVSAAGLVVIGSGIRNQTVRRRVFYPLAVGSVLLSAAAIIREYARSEYFREVTFQKILVDVGRKIGANQRNYAEVIVEKHGGQQYLYVVAFGGMSPSEFQKAPKEYSSVGVDLFRRIGKYRFVDARGMDSLTAALPPMNRSVLFVSPSKRAGQTAIDSVGFRNEKLYLLVRS